jgi:toxin HigB-1
VNFAFDTLAIRTLCECQSKAERAVGLKAAAHLRERLADIRAAESVAELLAGRPRQIQTSRHPHYAVDLADGYRLVFCANHVRIPLDEMDRVDWSRVSRVKILKIEVGHD